MKGCTPWKGEGHARRRERTEHTDYGTSAVHTSVVSNAHVSATAE